MFRDPNTWNNPGSVPEGSSDADDSLLFLQKHYEPIENKDDGIESYSIKARKFKEIQYLRRNFYLLSKLNLVRIERTK